VEVLSSLHRVTSVLVKNPMHILTILFTAATVLFLIINIQISRVLRTYRKLLHGVRGENIEEILHEYVERMSTMERKTAKPGGLY